MRTNPNLMVAALTAALSVAASAQQPATVPTTSLPVREVTVFKDGHAFVLREAPLPADAGGEVVLDELPAPVLGTFWPYASDGARLVSATAGRVDVTERVEPADLRQLAGANLGRAAVLQLDTGERLACTLRDLLGDNDDLLLVETAAGKRALSIGRVRELELQGDVATEIERKVARDRLSLRIAGGGPAAKVGVVYVQRGLRWIPSYRIELAGDGSGKAAVALQATLVNDLIDLVDADVHLVIGVPRFVFENMVDPISLQQQAAQVAAQTQYSQFGNMLSNGLMTQLERRSGGFRDVAQDAPEPEVDGGTSNEDLFVFTVEHVTLKKGERMVLPVRKSELRYRDVYRLDVPLAPPQEYQRNLQDQRVFELARMMAAPKARHVLRLENGSDTPLTTAPALVFEQGRLLAQSQVFYTSRGGTSDLEINTAIDIKVSTDEREAGRTGPVLLNGDNYQRIDLLGTITLKNLKQAPVTIEVQRNVLGLIDAADHDGVFHQVDLARVWDDGVRPMWWGWWSWPWWWFRWNGFGKVDWHLDLQPGQDTSLTAEWHYFWR
ncbi:MAG: hypothetical protein H6835_06425 [Planctomycetes bacterium]|nr:hypothetical protein [Planctomycetota bacterium]